MTTPDAQPADPSIGATGSLPEAGTPRAEVDVDAALVRRLLEEQQPDLASMPLRLIASGWDNCTFRLGDELAVRLPRRAVAAELIRNEQRWLPQIARRVSVAVPAPLRVGAPGCGYPWAWSVVRWIEGQSAERAPLSPDEARRFGGFFSELHVAASPDAPVNPYRGVPLQPRAETFKARLDRVARHARAPELGVDLERVRQTWRRALAAPIDIDGRWLHGDPHPKNVVVREGRLVAMIDWGDLTSGDPASDLAAAWMHFPVEAHGAFFDAWGDPSEALFARARGWAALYGTIFVDTGLAGDADFLEVGTATLRRLAESS